MSVEAVEIYDSASSLTARLGAGGAQLVSSGGTATAAIAAGVTTNTTIKAAAGCLCRVLVVTAGTVAMAFTDGPGGTVIGLIPASAAAGTITPFEMPAATSIIAVGAAGNPAVTVSYY